MDDPSPRRFHYDALITSVHDGDTVTVSLDLGHGVWLQKQALRLYGLNTPEITGPQKIAGQKSKDALVSLLAGLAVVVETIKDKDEKYGRVLAKVYVNNRKTGWLCVNDEMIRLGHALPWDGQGAKPV